MIGIFDSGFGGLTVLKAIKKTIPKHTYIYLGDNARVPYGNKSEDLVYEYACQAVDFLFLRGCKLAILACNTASALALRRLQQEYLPAKYPERRILGVIRPLAEEVGARKGVEKIGIIGTKATIESGVYLKEIAKYKQNARVYQVSTPLLVPLIEEAYNDNMVVDAVLNNYLLALKKHEIDYLILACTHYPLLIGRIRKIINPNCLVNDPTKIIASKLAEYLARHPELEFRGRGGSARYYCTDNKVFFRKVGEKIMGEKMKNLEKIVLWK